MKTIFPNCERGNSIERLGLGVGVLNKKSKKLQRDKIASVTELIQDYYFQSGRRTPHSILSTNLVSGSQDPVH